MKEITLQIPDTDYPVLMDIIKKSNLFVDIIHEQDLKNETEHTPKQKILEDIKQGFREMKAIKARKMKPVSLTDFLKNLKK